MKNQKRLEEMNRILNNTLNQMDNVFTSNLFAKVAEKNGITRKEIEYDCIAQFLKQKCKRFESNRKWVKKSFNKEKNSGTKEYLLLPLYFISLSSSISFARNLSLFQPCILIASSTKTLKSFHELS